jgi:hypothetical protein
MFNDEQEVMKALERCERESKYELEENRTMDYLIIYSLASRFVRPFKAWKAFELGLIDEEGKILRAPRDIKEKSALTPLDKVIIQIKRLIPKRLWYLLTAAYIFKGFIITPMKEAWDCNTEQEIIEVEQKKIKLEQAQKQVHGIIKNNPHFTEEEFWQHFANKDS